MGKRETLGFVLIGLTLIVWMWLQAPAPKKPAGPAEDSTAHGVPVQSKPESQPPQVVPHPEESKKADADSVGKYFSRLVTGAEKVLTIKTEKYTAEVTTRGGAIRKWELNDFRTWDGYPVQMVDPDQDGDFGLLFLSSDGKEIRTRSLYFESDYDAGKKIELSGDESYTVTLTLPISETQRIVKKLTFKNGSFTCDAEIEMVNLASVIANFEYQVTWEGGVRYAEHNSVDESNYAMAYAYAGGELAELDAKSVDEVAKRDINGETSWIAARNKYFGAALIPADGVSSGAYLEGHRFPQPDKGAKEAYSLALKIPFKGAPSEVARVRIFLGPLDFDLLKASGKNLDQIISLGATWIIRPISEYVMIPLFDLIRLFVSNYGIVIIIFSFIIKIVLHPLSKTSMKSMRKMQALQPMMTEIREKYKDDPQKMNQHVMNLYKDYGVNPAAGCLPLILQMPILFALYSVFRSSIGLRQAGFALWIKDLSIPDVAFTLPFTLPIVGITDVSGLALLMGTTMFIQQKMTVTDPRQKAMVWMMPIMMTMIFNNLPAGLNLYYFVFNLLSIGQQMWLKKNQGNEPLRKVERKNTSGGFLSKIGKDLPKLRK